MKDIIADMKFCSTCGQPHRVNERCKWPVPPLLSVQDAATLARLDDDGLAKSVSGAFTSVEAEAIAEKAIAIFRKAVRGNP